MWPPVPVWSEVDWFGLVGSALVLIPPIRMEYSKFRFRRAQKQSLHFRQQNLAALYHNLISYMRESRDDWKGIDSVSLGAGAFLLMLSFLY
jgi:hypothetical protein